jgi:hypothetical protein
MKRRGEMRREMRRIKGRRGEVEMSSQGNEGDRMAIEEDQNEDFWSLLGDLYCYGRLAVVSDVDGWGLP